jgi:hypothetical protein
MNRRRLEAEAIRDAILAVSGQLDLTLGGSTELTNAAMRGPLTAPAANVDTNRRSLYVPIIRNDVPDLLQVFDFGDPHAISGKRHVTSAATQALFMLNSEFIQQQSMKWAEHLLAATSNDKNRIQIAYLQSYGRTPTAAEVDRVLRFIESFQTSTEQRPDDSQKNPLQAWQAFCQAIFASTEFRFLN